MKQETKSDCIYYQTTGCGARCKKHNEFFRRESDGTIFPSCENCCLYAKKPKTKEKEIYVGWRYPCSGDLFVYKTTNFGNYLDWNLFNNHLAMILEDEEMFENYSNCPCGNNCKPIFCKITVENHIEK